MKSQLVSLIVVICFASFHLSGQVKSGKTTFSFNNAPVLCIENLMFVDENNDHMAGQNEKCFLVFNLLNKGKSPAKSVVIRTSTDKFEESLFAFEGYLKVGDIQVNERKEIKLPIIAKSCLEESKVSFQLIADEAGNYDSKPVTYEVPIKAIDASITIKWYSPYIDLTNVTDSIFQVKACIISTAPVDTVELYLNNKPCNLNHEYNITKSQDCDNFLEKEIKLQKGTNNLQIVAKNKKITLKSDFRTLVCNEISLERRVALIIGNSNYKNAPLRNPVNDADLMSIELKKLGFEVTIIKNGTQNEMKQAISKFGDALSKDKNTVGLFYYAGHGIQIRGINYLVPVDAMIEKEPDVNVFCVDLDGLLANLEYSGNNMNIVILDACRNNPYGRSFRSGAGPGLATINAPVGTLIAYATSPGSVAADGTGNNGLYTEEFVKAMKIPDIKIEDVFKKVRTQVKTISDGKQIPWENSSIEGDFYFLKLK